MKAKKSGSKHKRPSGKTLKARVKAKSGKNRQKKLHSAKRLKHRKTGRRPKLKRKSGGRTGAVVARRKPPGYQAEYNRGYDEAYNEGFNAGFAQGVAAGNAAA
ncbi:hypothetical protein [Gorillibacterium sp. sgz5001074]|uniref:hypothetical protein n=1 Tax=Gorillibacterium sp. sgz5001074 TaxID=3446695 RepID=UPI003F667EE1